MKESWLIVMTDLNRASRNVSPLNPIMSASALSLTGVLVFAYIYHIAPAFAYMGFTSAGSISVDFYLAAGTAVVAGMFLPRRLVAPSSWISWLLYVTVALPTSLIPFLAVEHVDAGFLVFSMAITLGTVGVAHAPRWRSESSSGVRKGPTQVTEKSYFALHRIVLIASVVLLPLLWITIGLHLVPPGFSGAYGVRAEFTDLGVAQSGALIAYALRWQAHVVGPALVWTALSLRRPLAFFIALVGQLTLYAGTGYRQIAITTFLVVSFWIFRRVSGSAPQTWAVTASLTAISVLAMFMDGLLSSVAWTSFIVRRLVAAPGLISWHYFDFFSAREKLFFSDSALSGLLTSPYAVRGPFLIGERLYGDPSVSANANVWADGYANGGYLGLLVVGLGLLFLVSVLDYMADAAGIPEAVSAATFGVAISLANTSLTSSVLTHGFAVLLVVTSFVWFVVRKPGESQELWRKGVTTR